MGDSDAFGDSKYNKLLKKKYRHPRGPQSEVKYENYEITIYILNTGLRH